MPDREEVRNQIVRAMHWQTFFIALLFVSITVIGFLGYNDSKKQDEKIARQAARVEMIAENNREGLCQFRYDLHRRWEAGVQFLEDNPDGIPGISDETLQRSIDSQRATLDALAVIDCHGIPDPFSGESGG